MKDATYEILLPLLRFLKSYEILIETPDSKFLLKGKDFIHFHDDPDGLWADVRLTKGRIRVSVATASEQRELMGQIADKLDALEHHRARGRKAGRSKRQDAWD